MALKWITRKRAIVAAVVLVILGMALLLMRLWTRHVQLQQSLISPPLVWHTLQGHAGKWAALDMPGNTHETEAYGVNNKGDVVGVFSDQHNTGHAFFFSNGVYQAIDVPNTTCGSEALGINNQGDIVGDYSTGKTEHGLLLSHGKYITIDAQATYEGFQLSGINDKGQIVGFYYDRNSHVHGFLWQHGKFSPISQLINQGIGGLGPTAINNLGQIVLNGCLIDKNGHHTAPGKYGIIGTSTHDQVGSYSDSRKHIHGFRLHNGMYTTIDIPSAIVTQAWAINDKGEIVGTYSDTNDQKHGFLLIPADHQK